jgi:hypothetical protein
MRPQHLDEQQLGELCRGKARSRLAIRLFARQLVENPAQDRRVGQVGVDVAPWRRLTSN